MHHTKSKGDSKIHTERGRVIKSERASKREREREWGVKEKKCGIEINRNSFTEAIHQQGINYISFFVKDSILWLHPK